LVSKFIQSILFNFLAYLNENIFFKKRVKLNFFCLKINKKKTIFVKFFYGISIKILFLAIIFIFYAYKLKKRGWNFKNYSVSAA